MSVQEPRANLAFSTALEDVASLSSSRATLLRSSVSRCSEATASLVYESSISKR